eukprot:gene57359-76581_t
MTKPVHLLPAAMVALGGLLLATAGAVHAQSVALAGMLGSKALL